MSPRVSRADASNAVLTLATLLVGLALLPRLPESMAIHFDAAGTPDNYVPRILGVLLMPATMVGTILVFRLAERYDPPEDGRTLAVVSVATMAFLAAIQGLVLAWNLGYDVPFDLLLVGVALWMVAVVGYALRRERTADAA